MSFMSTLFRKPDLDQVIATAKDPSKSLKKTLGPIDLLALGIGAIIGTGIFVLAGEGATYAGPAIILSFAVAGSVCALAGLCYAELASSIPTSGSAYGYTYAAMGESIAWIIGWALVLEYAVGAVTVSIGWSRYFGNLWNNNLESLGFGISDLFLLGPFDGGIINLPSVIIVLLCTMLLVRGASESAKATTALVILKLFIILLVITFGVFYISPENYTPFTPFGWIGTTGGTRVGVLTGAAIVFFAYIGFDAVSTTAEEAKNPGRDLPIGILGSLAVCTILYLLAAAVLVGMVPFQDFALVPEAEAPFEYAFSLVGQNFLASFIAAGALAGITSVLLVLLLGGPRVFFALARDGLLPESMAKVHPKHGTPYVTTAITGISVAAVAGFLPLGVVAQLTNIGTLFAFMLVCASVFVLRIRRPDLERPFKVPMGKTVAVLGVLACLVLIFSLNPLTHSGFLAWMGFGLMIYALYGIRKSKLARLPEGGATAPAAPVVDRTTD